MTPPDPKDGRFHALDSHVLSQLDRIREEQKENRQHLDKRLDGIVDAMHKAEKHGEKRLQEEVGGLETKIGANYSEFREFKVKIVAYGSVAIAILEALMLVGEDVFRGIFD